MSDQSTTDKRVQETAHGAPGADPGKRTRSHASGRYGMEQPLPMFLGGMIAPETPVTLAGGENAMRAQAYSQVLAARIEQEVAFIKNFRRDHLLGGMVPLDRLIDWVIERFTKDGPPIPLLTGLPWTALRRQENGSYLLSGDVASALQDPVNTIDQDILGTPLDPQDPPRLTLRDLWILKPSVYQDWLAAEAVPVRLGGVLDELRRFTLEFRHGTYWVWRNDPSMIEDQHEAWDQARIVAFVLTGYVPLLPEAQVPTPTGRGSRLQSAKHLQLAVFTARHPTESLRVRMEAWNDQYSEWTYKEISNFGWDSLEAVRRLLNEPSKPPSSMSEWFKHAFAAGTEGRAAEERHMDTDSKDIMKKITWQFDDWHKE